MLWIVSDLLSKQGVILITFFVFILSLIISYYIRNHVSINVNCWFCGKDCKVLFKFRNSFDCINCEQYNGFNKDGDYNKPIPSQEHESYNPVGSCQRGTFNVLQGVLCRSCTFREQLKMEQILKFESLSNATYDTDIELYKKHLEQVYHLCRKCEVRVFNKILEQDQILARNLIGYNILRPDQSDLTVNKKRNSIQDRLHTYKSIGVRLILIVPYFLYIVCWCSFICTQFFKFLSPDQNYVPVSITTQLFCLFLSMAFILYHNRILYRSNLVSLTWVTMTLLLLGLIVSFINQYYSVANNYVLDIIITFYLLAPLVLIFIWSQSSDLLEQDNEAVSRSYSLHRCRPLEQTSLSSDSSINSSLASDDLTAKLNTSVSNPRHVSNVLVRGCNQTNSHLIKVQSVVDNIGHGINGISLGQIQRKKSQFGAFGVPYDAQVLPENKVDSSSNVGSVHQRRPLIRPAKLEVTPPGATDKNFSTWSCDNEISSHRWTSFVSRTDTRESIKPEEHSTYDNMEEDNCPVDSTTPSWYKTERSHSWKATIMFAVLTVSVIFNIVLIMQVYAT